jgi:hypothetical protein
MYATSSIKQNKLSILLNQIYQTTKCLKLWIYLDQNTSENDFIVTEETSNIFAISPSIRKDLNKEVKELERKGIINVTRDPQLKGIITLFINNPHKIYDN